MRCKASHISIALSAATALPLNRQSDWRRLSMFRGYPKQSNPQQGYQTKPATGPIPSPKQAEGTAKWPTRLPKT